MTDPATQSTVSSLISSGAWGLACAFIGTVYATVVASERSPLDPWFDLLRWMDYRTGWLAPISWIAKPLGACSKCVSGWLAIFTLPAPWPTSPEAAISYLLAAAIAVIFAHTLSEHYLWLKNRM